MTKIATDIVVVVVVGGGGSGDGGVMVMMMIMKKVTFEAIVYWALFCGRNCTPYTLYTMSNTQNNSIR